MIPDLGLLQNFVKQQRSIGRINFVENAQTLVPARSLSRYNAHLTSLPDQNLLSTKPFHLNLLINTREPNISTYHALIKDANADPHNAISLYVHMRRNGVHPNKHTFPLLLKSKTDTVLPVFTHAIKFGLDSDRFVGNSLISTLCNCGFLDSARRVFNEMAERDVVAYTALINGYIKNLCARQALELFLEMKRLGILVDEVAVVGVLCAIGMLGCVWFGRWIHGFYIEPGRVVRDVYVNSALVDMYLKCGCCDDALQIFLSMPYRNVVSWSALISGYVQCDRFLDALYLFREMQVEKIEPNEATLTSVLTACAQLGALEQGRWVHKYIETHKLELNSVLGTAFIDMYAKCGCIKEAFHIFDNIRVKDVYPWTSLIFGLAMNGAAKASLAQFHQMLRTGVQPNEVTFIAVLSACSHGGLVNEGKELFKAMNTVYGIQSNVDHYGCIIDLLGRAGNFEEAVWLIKDLPMEPSETIWGALFAACMIHKNYELGRIVGNYLVELQPSRSGRYALLANLYSRCRDWKEVANVRRKMSRNGVRKVPGCSWIEIDGLLHEFVASDKSRVELESVCSVLNNLKDEMKHIPCLVPLGLKHLVLQ